MSATPEVLLIGAGRMAFHLGHALVQAGIPLLGVMGRDVERTHQLALNLRCPALPWRPDPPPTTITLLAVRDDAVAEVAHWLRPRSGVLAHTSGALDLVALKPHERRGVLWPIQSLSPGTPTDLGKVPLVVDGSDETTRAELLHLARSISGRAVQMPGEQRQLVHLAAVFASNFPVFLLDRAQELLRREGLPDDLLLPLWSATTAKAAAVGPATALTGPAKRGDLHTIKRHLDRLKDDADLRRAYDLLSRMISAAHGPKAE
ncbi:MAG: DUF2520 domain-containing protein [Flavobacteriales bacterium]|nr:DUF2520 domain-containing protein [Flavobacteriales bacterium]